MFSILLGGILPPLVWMIWFSEAIGSHSLDRRQVVIVFFAAAFLMLLWWWVFVFLVSDWEVAKQMESNKIKSESSCCADLTFNETVCLCPLSALGVVAWSALPEEIVKYFAVAVFSYRSYVADPDAVLSLALISGAGFAMIENVMYIYAGAIPLMRALFSFPLHVVCQLIMGVFISRRKFVHRESGQQRVCCDSCACGGKMPWWKVIALPVLIHAIHNFTCVLTEKSNSPLIVLLTYVLISGNLAVWYCFLRVKYNELHAVKRVDVRRLQREGMLPSACVCVFCYNRIERSNLVRRMTSIYEMEDEANLEVPATAIVVR